MLGNSVLCIDRLLGGFGKVVRMDEFGGKAQRFASISDVDAVSNHGVQHAQAKHHWHMDRHMA